MPRPSQLARFSVVASTALLVFIVPVPCPGADFSSAKPIPGLAFEAEVILDSITLIDGGTSPGSASALLGKSTFTFDLDTSRANVWKGGRVLVQLSGTFGDEPSSMAGDLQGFDNIEAGDDSGILEAWVEQSLGSRASLLVGYHDLNREFDVIENAGELLNSSFGIGPEISQVGPSIFPRTHLGARLELRPTSRTWVRLAGYDGLACEATDGSFYAFESGWLRDRVGPLHAVKVAVGAWHVDSRGSSTENLSEASGGYLVAEATHVTRHGATVGAFVRAGRSSTRLHPVERYTGAGIRLGNFIAGRPDDVVSLGVARADIGRAHRLGGSPSAETTFELTWLARMNDWIAVQPDIQYIDSPAGEIGLSHALVGGVRLILTY